jgi:DNA-directed RNA polymerase subunit RPC12/RpoP
MVDGIRIRASTQSNITMSTQQINVEPGQRWYNEKEEQHCVVLGKNHMGAWLLQYEDGDIVEWNRNGIGTPNKNPMVYRRAPRNIEEKRPTLEGACEPNEHVFLGGPFHFPLPRQHKIKCGKCGLHVTALEEDLGLGNKLLKLLPYKCNNCNRTLEKGEKPNLTVMDKLLCDKCAAETENEVI